MTTPTTRRRVLRATAGGFALVSSGCLGGTDDAADPGTDRTDPTTGTSTETATTVRVEPDEIGIDGNADGGPPASPPLPASGAWPAYRFDARNTGSRLEGRGLRDGAAYWRIDGGEVPYWRFEGGGAPATDGERLFNVAKGPEGDVFLARRDPRTLAIASRTEFEWAGEVIHPPTVAGDRTFLTRFESVICFATDRDEVLWRGPTMDGISGAPTVHDDTVLVATGGFTGVDPQLRAFATEDGEQLWRYDGGTDAGTPAVADGTAFVGGSDGVHAVDLATGERRFRAPDVTDDLAAPIVADGTVVSTYDLLGMVVALSADDGTVLWRHAAETDRPPVVAEGEVYVDTGTEEGTVALDLEDGSVRRTFDGGGAPVARVGDVLYTASNGVLRALDVDGSHLWTHATERVQVDDMIGQGISGVTPVDGAVYVAARDGLHGIGPRPD